MKKSSLRSRVTSAAIELLLRFQRDEDRGGVPEGAAVLPFFSTEPLALEDAGQLLWAAQGVTGLGGLRTAPSAGAVYPLHLYLIAMDVAGLRPGAYAYDPDRHVISLWKAGDLRAKLKKAACDQEEVEDRTGRDTGGRFVRALPARIRRPRTAARVDRSRPYRPEYLPAGGGVCRWAH
jgi:hypothetical protein